MCQWKVLGIFTTQLDPNVSRVRRFGGKAQQTNMFATPVFHCQFYFIAVTISFVNVNLSASESSPLEVQVLFNGMIERAVNFTVETLNSSSIPNYVTEGNVIIYMKP